MQYTFILSCAFIMACTTTSSFEHVALRCLSQRGWTLFSRRQVKAVDTLPEALTTLVRSSSYHHTEPILSLRFDVNHQLHLVWFLLYSIPTLPHSVSQPCYVCVSVCDQVSLGAVCVYSYSLVSSAVLCPSRVLPNQCCVHPVISTVNCVDQSAWVSLEPSCVCVCLCCDSDHVCSPTIGCVVFSVLVRRSLGPSCASAN